MPFEFGSVRKTELRDTTGTKESQVVFAAESNLEHISTRFVPDKAQRLCRCMKQYEMEAKSTKPMRWQRRSPKTSTQHQSRTAQASNRECGLQLIADVLTLTTCIKFKCYNNRIKGKYEDVACRSGNENSISRLALKR